jgi:hypothetical protein
MVEHILALFPRLRVDSLRVTSTNDPVYNCVAWAAGVTDDWWWPLENPADAYWPASAPRVRTLEAFHAAFATLGYVLCQGESLEPEYEKVALFADDLDRPTHVARQLPSGRWTSKLGRAEDVEHDLHDLEGELYGRVVLLMQRRAGQVPG